jgi:hypothetical protein
MVAFDEAAFENEQLGRRKTMKIRDEMLRFDEWKGPRKRAQCHPNLLYRNLELN